MPDQRPIVYLQKKIKIWKLKDRDQKEQFQQLSRTQLPKDETQSVEEKWQKKWNKIVQENTLSDRQNKRSGKEKNNAQMEWFKESTKKEK
jgi:hypothetical protein